MAAGLPRARGCTRIYHYSCALPLDGDGGRDHAALTIRLSGGAGLELLRSRISAYSTNIDGIPSGGPVRLFASSIGNIQTGAGIDTAGDVSLRRSSLDALRGGGLVNLNGSVELLESGLGGRDGVYLRAGPGGVRVQRSYAGGGLGPVQIEALRGGDVTVVESRLGHVRVRLEPDAARRAGAAVLLGNETSAPPYIPAHVTMDLPAHAGCYAADNAPEITCPAGSAP